MPYKDKLLALLTFNLGVEIGQVVFIAAVILILNYVARLIDETWQRNLTIFADYSIGVMSCFWFLTRLAAI